MEPEEALPVTAEALGLARRLVEALGWPQIMDYDGPQMIRDGSGVEEQDLTVEQRRAAYEASRDTWADVRHKALAQLTDFYAKRLTPAELREALSFFEGPVGKKLIEKERGAVFTDFQEEDAVLEDFISRYCARGGACMNGRPVENDDDSGPIAAPRSAPDTD
jgi:hypothetical protein